MGRWVRRGRGGLHEVLARGRWGGGCVGGGGETRKGGAGGGLTF